MVLRALLEDISRGHPPKKNECYDLTERIHSIGNGFSQQEVLLYTEQDFAGKSIPAHLTIKGTFPFEKAAIAKVMNTTMEEMKKLRFSAEEGRYVCDINWASEQFLSEADFTPSYFDKLHGIIVVESAHSEKLPSPKQFEDHSVWLDTENDGLILQITGFYEKYLPQIFDLVQPNKARIYFIPQEKRDPKTALMAWITELVTGGMATVYNVGGKREEYEIPIENVVKVEGGKVRYVIDPLMNPSLRIQAFIKEYDAASSPRESCIRDFQKLFALLPSLDLGVFCEPPLGLRTTKYGVHSTGGGVGDLSHVSALRLPSSIPSPRYLYTWLYADERGSDWRTNEFSLAHQEDGTISMRMKMRLDNPRLLSLQEYACECLGLKFI